MNDIDIELKKRSRMKNFLSMLHSRLEDWAFRLILKIPERFVPAFLMEWLDRYTAKRLNDLQAQIIKDKWKSIELQKTLDKISKQ